ncbi:MAG: histidine kinase dimerization/phosphoacceptor domain -containing protein [Ekhidna sp.]
MRFRYILLFLLGTIPAMLFGQFKYPHRYFDPREYQSDREILSIDQSEDGTMYFGTGTSLLVYDGERWQESVIPGKKVIYWIKVDDASGRIYLGSNGEFGYFDSELTYFSLSDRLDTNTSDFGPIWEVDLSSHGVYFRSSKYIFRYCEDELSRIDKLSPNNSRFDVMFTVNDTIITKIRNVGLVAIYNGELEVLADSEEFDEKANAFLPHPGGILIATRSSGLFLYKDHIVQPFDAEVNDYLQEYPVYHAATLSNGHFAFATLTGGVLIMDKNGGLVHLIKQSNYGIHEGTQYVFEDSRSGLWVGTKRGMARVDINSPVQYYQLEEMTENMSYEYFDNKFYFGAINGMYALEDGNKTPQKVQGFPNLVNRIFEMDGILMATDLSDTYIVEEDMATKIFYPPLRSIAETDNENYDFVGGTQEGLIFFEKDPEWRIIYEDEETVKNVTDLITHDAKIWGISSRGLFRYNDGNVTFYDLEGAHSLDQYKNQLIATSNEGFYSYDAVNDQFESFLALDTLVPESAVEVDDFYIQGDSTWLLYFNAEKVLTGDVYAGNQLVKKLPLFDARLEEDISIELVNGFLFIDNGADIFRYDINTTDKRSENELASIHSDKLLEVSDIPYTQNQLRFDFSVKATYSFGENYYRYKIDGYNDEWSEWSTQNYMEITNLFEGNYNLMLEAKTPDRSVISSSLSFTILPPWYRTYWAYISYVVFSSLLIWRFVKWRSSYLEDERNKLEELVSERTSEIIAQKATIEQALKEREVLLREIHHRVKNNLQVISSIFNMQSKEARTDEVKKLINDGQSRVKTMSLIHQKLYQSDKLDAIDFKDYTEGLISQISQLYSKKECQIVNKVMAKDIHLDIDTAIPIGLILNELLSNSYKYAFDEGKGNISIQIAETCSGSYQLKYCDDGKGFPDGFDWEKSESLGLRLVSILARQLKGTMEFKNGNGACFTISFRAVDL